MVQLINLLSEADNKTRQQLAELYCRIWLEPPWNEADWTVERVITDLDQELSLPGAIGYAASDPSVVGFTWGYQVNKEQLAVISGNDMLGYLFIHNELTFYIDELGVEKDYRKQGVGRILTDRLLGEVWQQKYQQVVLRTDDQADAAIKLYRRLGFVDQPSRDTIYSTRRYWVLKKH